MKISMTIVCMLLCGAALAGTTSPDKAAVDSALGASMGAKVLVADHFFKTGRWASSNAEVGYTGSGDASAVVAIGQAGVVTIRFSGPVITLTPSNGGNGQVQWSCKGTGFADGVLPEACR